MHASLQPTPFLSYVLNRSSSSCNSQPQSLGHEHFQKDFSSQSTNVSFSCERKYIENEMSLLHRGIEMHLERKKCCVRALQSLSLVSNFGGRTFRSLSRLRFGREPPKERNFWSGKSSEIGINRGSCAVLEVSPSFQGVSCPEVAQTIASGAESKFWFGALAKPTVYRGR